MGGTVAERLRIARVAAGFHQGKLAAEAHGWNLATYKTHESLDRSDRPGTLRPDVAKDYADAYGVSVLWLLYGEGEMKPKPVSPTVKQLLALLDGMDETAARRILTYAEGIAA